MKRLVISAAKALPPQFRKKLEKMATPITGSIARRGVTASKEARNWTSSHRRSVSIVIPSYNDFKLISKCINSVKTTCSNFEYEIIVVDDYCQPQNTARLETLADDKTRVIFKKERSGFAITVNIGMAAANMEDIVLLNSDTVALPGWLEELQFAAHGIDQSIGLVSPKLIYPSGRIQYGGTFHARDIAPQWFAHLNAGKWTTHPDGNVPGYIFGISGACMYITRFAYDRLGGLDETYWLGFEDVDYAMEAWTKGIRCYYQPQSVLFHHESASRGYSQGKRELASLRYFWRKWDALFSAKSYATSRVTLDFYVDRTQASDGWLNHITSLQNIAIASGYRVNTYDSSLPIVIGKQTSQNQHGSIKIACDSQSAERVWLDSAISNPAIRIISEDSLLRAQIDATEKALLKPEFYFATSTEPHASLLNRITPWKSQAVVYPLSAGTSSKPNIGNPERIIVLTSGDKPDLGSFPKEFTVKIRTTKNITNKLCQEIADQDFGVIVNLLDGMTAEQFNQLTNLGAALISVKSDGLELIALDGYNCLLIDRSDATLIQRIKDLAGDSTMIQELTSNARNSYTNLVLKTQRSFSTLLTALTKDE